MPDAETRKAAIAVIARHLARRAVSDAFEFDRIGWEHYPDISMDAWTEVADRAKAIAESIAPTAEQYQAAYDHLTPNS